MAGPTPRSLRMQADRLERLLKKKQAEQDGDKKRTTFSHIVMGGIMMMFFVGVALGVFVTVFRGEQVSVTMDYIMELAKIVSLGYFVKAFGENIAKIVLSALFGNRLPDTSSQSENEGGDVG